MSYYLAADGGGTKTAVICADESGQIVGKGISGPTNLTTTSVGAASFNLREAVRQATETLPEGWQVKTLAMGLAGMDTPGEEAIAHTLFAEALNSFSISTIILVNDIVIALESGTDKTNAIALIAGTGSHCYGRNARGQTAKTGGMDFLLTDQGSGYAIGRAVLRAAVKGYDGRGERTLLEQLLCEYFRIPHLAELKTVVYHPLLGKAEIADLAKLCVTAFDQGDAVARCILEQTADELTLMVTTVSARLEISSEDTDCVLVGGITQIGYVHERLRGKLQSSCPQLQLITPVQPPTFGALKLAMRDM